MKPDQATDTAAMARVAELLEISTAETVRKWVRRAARRRRSVRSKVKRTTTPKLVFPTWGS